jgi:hypothetical protein
LKFGHAKRATRSELRKKAAAEKKETVICRSRVAERPEWDAAEASALRRSAPSVPKQTCRAELHLRIFSAYQAARLDPCHETPENRRIPTRRSKVHVDHNQCNADTRTYHGTNQSRLVQRSIDCKKYRHPAKLLSNTSSPEKQMEYIKEYKLPELTMLTVGPVVRRVKNWWLRRAEDHYLICANVEMERAREAHQNMAYYQKQAALARSARG